MKLIRLIFDNPQASFDPLSFIGVLATILVTIYIFRSETSLPLTKERHEKLIFPLFNLLEPFLYQELDREVLNTAFQIIEQNKFLSDGKLLAIHYYCKTNPNDKNIRSLYSYIDRAYDKSCRRLKLGVRSLSYKIIRSQYKNKTSVILYIIRNFLIALFCITVMFLFITYILVLACAIFNTADDTAQILYLIIFVVTLLPVYKFAEKHL